MLPLENYFSGHDLNISCCSEWKHSQTNWWQLSKIIPVLFRNTDSLKSLWVSLHRRAQLQSQQTTQFNCLHSSNTCIGCWTCVSFCSSAAVLQQRHYWWRKFDFKSRRFWQDSCGFMFSVNLCACMCNRFAIDRNTTMIFTSVLQLLPQTDAWNYQINSIQSQTDSSLTQTYWYFIVLLMHQSFFEDSNCLRVVAALILGFKATI